MSTLKTIDEPPTYAISLFFDEQSTEKLTSLIKSVAEITDNFYVVKNNIPPHITLAMFKEKTQPQQSVQTEQNLQKLKDWSNYVDSTFKAIVEQADKDQYEQFLQSVIKKCPTAKKNLSKIIESLPTDFTGLYNQFIVGADNVVKAVIAAVIIALICSIIYTLFILEIHC